MTAVLTASFIPRAGQDDAVEVVLRRMVGFTRAEPGCLRYDLYRTQTGFLLHEIYLDEAALQTHRAAGYFADYRRDIADLLAEPIRVEVLLAVDAKDLATVSGMLLGG